MVKKIELGKKVRDKITGFEGIVTARTEYLHGCNRYYVEPKVGKDGSHREGQTFDEGSLEIVDEGIKAKEVETEKKGGSQKYDPKGRF